MTKYIDSEKLKAEIERLKKDNGRDGRPSNVAEMLYSHILSIITSLQQEQPSLHSNLDEAAVEYAWQKEGPLAEGERLSTCFDPRIEAFKSGAEWMVGQMKHEQPEYGYLTTTYISGKKARWNIGDTLAYYECTSNEEGEVTIGKITKVEFNDEEGWVYTFEDGNTWDEQGLVEEEVYKIVEK